MPKAYYNEIDPGAAQWLRNLIAAGHIAPGDVDERSIADVRPEDLHGYTQCHFFAGIGVWSLALRRAGWRDDEPAWTGSCPCQPFSAAGRSGGFDDERHLWPEFHRLIKECRPAVVFGEQVASKATEPWFDLVQTDLEALDYAFGCVPFPSAGVGAPHLRDRAYWVADASEPRLQGRERQRTAGAQRPSCRHSTECGGIDGMADTNGRVPRETRALQPGRQQRLQQEDGGALWPGYRGSWTELSALAYPDGQKQPRVAELRRAERDGEDTGRAQSGGEPEPRSVAERMADAECQQCEKRVSRRGESHCSRSGGQAEQFAGLRNADGVAHPEHPRHNRPEGGEAEQSGNGENRELSDRSAAVPAGESEPSPTNGPWAIADWLFCRDGKWRPVEPGTSPLANGTAERVGRMQSRLAGMGFSESDIKLVFGRRNSTLSDANGNRVTRIKGYGNAINAEAATTFIECYRETRTDQHTIGETTND